MSDDPTAYETAVLGGGCFWCVEAVYQRLAGVVEVSSGYAGGERAHPRYEEVCRGEGGHIEVARIVFDPARIDFKTILEVFFASHDPTSLDRQGADAGPQYRSVIFCQRAAQRDTARRVIAVLDAAGLYPSPIVTELRDAAPVWPAEAEHARYYQRHPEQAYCRWVIAPKLDQLEAQFPALLADSSSSQGN